MRRLVALSIALALTGSFAATAQTPGSDREIAYQDAHCGQRAAIVAKLGEVFRENPAAVGVVNQDAVIEIFVSSQGTWTILATGTDGQSCVVSSGEDWESTSMVIGEDA